MNTVRTSVRKNQNLILIRFLNSLFYTFPVGMFLTACNFMFEFVRNYYFDWWIVVFPTVAVLIISNLYEAFWIYQKSGKIYFKKKAVFVSKPSNYAITKSKMVVN